MRQITYLLILFLAVSCSYEKKSKLPDTFQPKTKKGAKSYTKEDFQLITSKELKDHWIWVGMNYADEEIGVFKSGNSICLKETSNENEYFFELEDGKLEVENYGEFGGAFNFIPSNSKKDTVKILETNVICVFRFKDEIYFLLGIAHMSDRGGILAKLIRKGNTFKYKSILELSSAPETMTIYKDRIIIAGHQNLTVIKGFKKEYEIEYTFWDSLYPNSIVALNDDEIYVGFRGGYAAFSLNTKKISYYKHKSVKYSKY